MRRWSTIANRRVRCKHIGWATARLFDRLATPIISWRHSVPWRSELDGKTENIGCPRPSGSGLPPLPVIPDGYEIEEVRSPIRALTRMTREHYAGVFVAAGHVGEAFRMGKLLQNERILEGMPDGIVLLDADNTIIWGNGRLREWTGRDTVVGENFYSVLNSPEILGPDFCPFHTALTTGKASSSTLRGRATIVTSTYTPPR